MKNIFKNKVVLITGGTGTIGSELVRQILQLQPRQVRVFSRDDTRQHDLQESLPRNAPVRFLIGDVREYRRLNVAMRGVQIVLHAAALKHVPAAEYNPYEAVKTNIIGSQNVIECAIEHRVERVIAISTDKAVNPKNVLGTSKLMMEKLFTNANFTFGLLPGKDGMYPTRFSCVRFGNVAWSRGSVLPHWKVCAERSGEILVSDPSMTRFMISNLEAVRLVLSSAELMRGGEIFVLKMPSIKLGDLARLFVKKFYPKRKIKITVIGNRGGEKHHEELFLKDEHATVFENKDMLISVPHPQISRLVQPRVSYAGFKPREPKTYSSKENIDAEAIEKLL
ncbi:MAG: Polysaccharide biosynthesis protein CapD [Parcubacteria group bacterium GW2011_GWA2_51_10]|nr:MAG: Polysaccharide biosynthesis protein CapD [Parcubacteria group bacterium GW2011_GWA2_51_10]